MRTRIAHTIEIFEAARRPLFTVLDGISREDLDWQPADGMRGVGKICRHMYRVDDKLHEIYNHLHPMDLRVCGAGFPPNDSRRVRDQPRTLLRPSSAVLSCPASGLW